MGRWSCEWGRSCHGSDACWWLGGLGRRTGHVRQADRQGDGGEKRSYREKIQGRDEMPLKASGLRQGAMGETRPWGSEGTRGPNSLCRQPRDSAETSGRQRSRPARRLYPHLGRPPVVFALYARMKQGRMYKNSQAPSELRLRL